MCEKFNPARTGNVAFKQEVIINGDTNGKGSLSVRPIIKASNPLESNNGVIKSGLICDLS